jgi:DNA-binding beta-propeller fold protein YncE
MVRRIDALFSSRADSKDSIKKKLQEMKVCAGLAKQSIDKHISELIAELQARQKVLHQEVDELLEKKSNMLNDQLVKVEDKKADETRRLQEDEKTLQRLKGLKDNSAEAKQIEGLEKSIANLQDNPHWLRLRTDEIVSFAPRKLKEVRELLNSFGAVDGASTYASESYAQGPLIEGPLKVGFKTWLLIRACDLYGKQRQVGGDKLCVKFSQDNVGKKHFEWELVDNEDGSYKLFVVPNGEGEYKLSLDFESQLQDGTKEAIKGSPFTLGIKPPFDYTVLGDDAMGQAGVPWVDNDLGFLRRPIGLQFDPTAEYVFVSDQCNDRIQVFETESKQSVCSFGKKGSGPKDLNTPGYMIVDREDRVIISDMLNHRLQVFNFNRNALQLRHLRTVGCQGSEPGQFSFPRGVALTQTGILLVCDSGNHRVQALNVNKDYSVEFEFGELGTEDGKFSQPYDIAVNSKDEVFVTDSCHRIQVFNMTGKFLRSWGKKGKSSGKFRHPTSITIDNEDSVFVCDQGNHRVQVFSSTGAFYHMWGGWLKKVDAEDPEAAERADSPTPDDGEWYGLLTPAGITVSPAGRVLVSDYDKHVVFDF